MIDDWDDNEPSGGLRLDLTGYEIEELERAVDAKDGERVIELVQRGMR